jgi:hypothetical protein
MPNLKYGMSVTAGVEQMYGIDVSSTVCAQVTHMGILS